MAHKATNPPGGKEGHADQETAQYLTFTLGGELFGIQIQHIKEIIEYGDITTVPMMPAAVRGVINLRGAVVPVVDLSVRFGRQPNPVSKRTCIVIIENQWLDENHYIGIIVDAVNEVLEIDAGQVEQTPAFGVKIRTDFIQAMGKINGTFVIILDVSKVLSVEEISQLHPAMELPDLTASDQDENI